jgi:hypothetical protein
VSRAGEGVSIVRLPAAALSSAAATLRRPATRAGLPPETTPPADPEPSVGHGPPADRIAPAGEPSPEPVAPEPAPAGDVVPARGTGSRLRRTREVLAAAAGSTGLAVAMTWPALRDPAHTVPQDLVDPMYFVWQLAWVGHALVTDPTDLWTTNAFSGASGNLAYTDTMLGYAPVSALGDGLGDALVIYNLLFVAATAFAFFGAYLLARVVGARWPGALVAAAAFAYAPWRLAHDRHLNVLSTGGIALTLALLAYGHGWSLRDRKGRDPAGPAGRRPPRLRWVVAGWAVACWQLTLGFAVGLPFAWALATVLAVAGLGQWVRLSRQGQRLRTELRRSRRLLLTDAAGALAFGVVGLLLTLPYQRVVSDFPVAKRTEEMLHRYSPPVHGLVTAPPESIWAGMQGGLRSSMAAVQEQALLPGFVVVALGLLGLWYSAWSRRHRVMLGLGALVATVLCLGTSGPFGGEYTYLPLFRHVPGWEALRTPGRLMLWVTLCLGLLAAGAVTRWADGFSRLRAARRQARAAVPAQRGSDLRTPLLRRLAVPGLALSLALPAALVLVEGTNRMAYPRVPAAPVPLAALPQPVMVLPTSQSGDFQIMTWSTDGWPQVANGGSGFEPPTQAALRRALRGFPDRTSVAALRGRGVRSVVLVPERARGTSWQDAAGRETSRLPLRMREVQGPDGPVVIYTLLPDELPLS